MTSEVCPFCGKTYKRLKSHLPHCKAAASSRSPPSSLTSSSQLESTTKDERSGETLTANAKPKSKKSKKESVVSTTPNLQSEDASLQSLSMSSSIATRKKNQKLSEQIKVATVTKSTTISPSLPPTAAKLKKKSVPHLSEATKSEQVSRESSAGIRSPQTRTKIKPEKVNASSGFLSNDANIEHPSEMEVSEMKTAAQVLSSTKDSPRPHAENSILIDREGEIKDLSKSGSGHQSKITLQDVKAVLGRAKNTSQSGRPSIMSQVRASGVTSKIKPSSSFSPAPLQTRNQEQLPSTSLQTASKSKQVSLITLQHDNSPQFVPMSPSTPVLPGYLSSQVSQSKTGNHMTGLTAISPLMTPLPTSKMFLGKVEPLKADDGLTMGESHLVVRNQISVDNQTQGALVQQRLGHVKLKELPNWLVCKTPSNPRDLVKMVQKGWQWYYKRYIDVKKGGVGGLSMLLAGYCVLSYVWSYPRIKHDRWRKYH